MMATWYRCRNVKLLLTWKSDDGGDNDDGDGDGDGHSDDGDGDGDEYMVEKSRYPMMR